jgi:hypothetical protein
MSSHTGFIVAAAFAPTAEELLREYGTALLDKYVFTQPFGSWPGGVARIIQIRPDENAPEIVFTVRGENDAVKRAVGRGHLDGNEIGVFDYEQVVLLTQDTAV